MSKKKLQINMETFDLENQIFRQKTETHAVFTIGKTEKLAMGEEAASKQQDAFELEDKVKRFKKEQDDTIKALRSDVSKILQKIFKGEEERKIECLAEYDYTNYKIRYVNLSTGEIVKETDMDEFTMNNIPPELNPEASSKEFENNPQMAADEAPAIDGTKGPEISEPAPAAEALTPALIESVIEKIAVETAQEAVNPAPTVPVQPAVNLAQVAPIQQAAAQPVQAAPVVQPVQTAPVQPMAVPIPQPIASEGSFDNAFTN